jgi:hypothetical protein
VKGNVYAEEELMDEKKVKGMCMLEKLERLDNLERRTRISAFRSHYSENNSRKMKTRQREGLRLLLHQV